jgi:asparagine synthase (glutamine-hydrolysing)
MLSEDMSQGIESETVEYPNSFDTWDSLQQGQFLEISTFLSSYLLSSQGDRVAMAHSVEGRYPFLDKQVVEFCTMLPARMKLRGLKDKYVLRKVAQDYIPASIAGRPKRPYRAPIQKCFFNERCPSWTQEILDPASVRTAGLFKAAAVEQLVRKANSAATLGETDEMALVGIISAQLLHRFFISDFRHARPVGGRDNIKVVDRRASMASVPLS